MPSLAQTARRSARAMRPCATPQALAALPPAQLRGTRARSISRAPASSARPTGRCFIDKMPNNFLHVGLHPPDAAERARSSTPAATRSAAASRRSSSISPAARTSPTTWTDIGRYYRDYVELMAHFDRGAAGARAPRPLRAHGRGHRGARCGALLDYCGLPFEPACLRFYENERAVRTASSEQVRQPIYREGVEHWRHFEPWLEPLKECTGPVLEAYPRGTGFC